MDSKDLARRVGMLNSADESRYLVRLLFNLTVVARNTYVVGEDDVDRPKALRGIVEICHKTSSRIQSISNGQFSIPVSDFCDSIFGIAEIYGCLFELENAIEFSE